LITQPANYQNFMNNTKATFLALALVISTSFSSFASGGHDNHGEAEKFVPGDVIIHHVLDNHEIHIGNFHIPLPIILWDNGKLVGPFSSSNLSHGNSYLGYVMDHEKIYYADETGSKVILGYDEKTKEPIHSKPLDFSITKSVVGIFITSILMLLMFFAVSKGYKKRAGQAPKGIQSALEPLIVFVRDEVAKPSIGKKYEKFMPYLLTVFFFIWIANLLGLIPFIGGFNVTGNIAVALVLAFITFLITAFSGNKDYWLHIFWTPGVPVWLKATGLMILIEFIGFVSKPIVLTLRLFANITAGHIIILSFVSLIFIFNNMYGAGGGFGVSLVSVIFSIFMFCIELLVAFLQAYVFTLLSALYFGSAVEEHAHEH
jgi:F-type H+-transporting ATPase subunit a